LLELGDDLLALAHGDVAVGHDADGLVLVAVVHEHAVLVPHPHGEGVVLEALEPLGEPESEDVGLNELLLDLDLSHLAQLLSQVLSLFVVLIQLLPPVLQVLKACSSQNTGLSHVAAEQLSQNERVGNVCLRSHDEGADRAPQALA